MGKVQAKRKLGTRARSWFNLSNVLEKLEAKRAHIQVQRRSDARANLVDRMLDSPSVDPRTNSIEASSITTTAPSRTNSMSSGSAALSGVASSEKAYENPEQPPPSTDNRSLVLGSLFFNMLIRDAQARVTITSGKAVEKRWREASNCPNRRCEKDKAISNKHTYLLTLLARPDLMKVPKVPKVGFAKLPI